MLETDVALTLNGEDSMTVGDGSQMLRQYIALFRKWFWLVILGTMLAGGSALAVSLHSTPIYEAVAVLYITPGDTASISAKQNIQASAAVAVTPQINHTCR